MITGLSPGRSTSTPTCRRNGSPNFSSYGSQLASLFIHFRFEPLLLIAGTSEYVVRVFRIILERVSLDYVLSTYLVQAETFQTTLQLPGQAPKKA